MKKLMTLMLGLAFLTTSVVVFAQSTSDTAKKAPKKNKKGKKSTDTNSPKK